MRLLKVVLFTLLFALVGAVHARADEAVVVVDRAMATSEDLIKRIRNEIFEPTILTQKPSYLAAERSIKVVVRRDLRPGAMAYVEGKKKIIDYNVGTTLAVVTYVHYAAIRVALDQRMNANCRNYMAYLGDELKKAADKTPEQFYRGLTPPDRFCGVDARFNEEPLKSVRDKLMLETLIPVVALMLGHEVGHHLLRHLPPKEVSAAKAREIEAEADRFASVLASDKVVRAPASVIFTILAAARKGHPFNPDRRHDTAECRFIFFLRDDQRILGEQLGVAVLNKLRGRKDIEEQIPRAVSLIRSGVIDHGVPSTCGILN